MKKTVLNSIKIKENLVKFDKIDFGCDYLNLSYGRSIEKLDNLLFGVDSDNSNFGVLEIAGHNVSYNRIPTNNGFGLTFVVDYNGIPTPLFQYVHFNAHTRKIFSRSSKISIYGAYFRLEAIGEFEYHSLLNYISSLSLEDPIITRFDFRIDYFSREKVVSVPLITDICGYLHEQSSEIIWKSGGKLTDWRVGNPDTGRYAIRYYDKKLDTNLKNKWFLYTDFLDYKSVHRLEIEFGRAFCREYSLSQFNELEYKILGVLGIDGMTFDSSLFYQYNSNSEITLENAGRFIQRFMNQSKKLLKAGYNPLSIVEECMIGQYGIEVTRGLIDDFISKSCVRDVRY